MSPAEAQQAGLVYEVVPGDKLIRKCIKVRFLARFLLFPLIFPARAYNPHSWHAPHARLSVGKAHPSDGIPQLCNDQAKPPFCMFFFPIKPAPPADSPLRLIWLID